MKAQVINQDPDETGDCYNLLNENCYNLYTVKKSNERYGT